MKTLIDTMIKTGILKKDLDYHLTRASLASTIDAAIIH